MLRRMCLALVLATTALAATQGFAPGAQAAPRRVPTCARSTNAKVGAIGARGSGLRVLKESPAPAPVLNRFRPFFGAPGRRVIITGRNLCGASVSFNGTPATIVRNTSNRIGTRVPVGATTGPIRITTDGGTIASSQSYTVT
jgi:IPT/TIG domain-containing protein